MARSAAMIVEDNMLIDWLLMNILPSDMAGG